MNEIDHIGKIIEITPEFTTVEVQTSSACGECRAKGLCGLDDSESRLIIIPTDPYELYQTGEEVQVCLKQTMGLKAVWLGYAVPGLVLLALILIFSHFLESEVMAGVLSIAGVGIYYLLLLVFKKKLSNEYVFYIKKSV